MAAYLEKLQIYPSETVAEACRRLGRRPGAFPPSAGDVRDECERIAVRTTPALPAPKHTHAADSMTDEARERLKIKFQSFAAELASRVEAKRDGWRPPTKDEARDWLAAHEGGHGLPPVTVSERLAEKLADMGMALDV